MQAKISFTRYTGWPTYVVVKAKSRTSFASRILSVIQDMENDGFKLQSAYTGRNIAKKYNKIYFFGGK